VGFTPVEKSKDPSSKNPKIENNKQNPKRENSKIPNIELKGRTPTAIKS